MSRVIVLSKIAAFVAFLFFAIPAHADEIEPEPEPAPMAEPEPEPEPEPDPVPEIPMGDDYARNGIYLGAQFSGAWFTEVKEDVKDAIDPPPPALALLYAPNACGLGTACTGGTLEIDNPLGLGARAGYRFHPHFAAEVELQWFSKSTTELTYGKEPNKNTLKLLKLETLMLTGNVKGFLLTGRIQPYLLVGAGLMHADVTDKLNLGLSKSKIDSFAARFGTGLDVYLTKNIVGVAEVGYLLPTGDASGLDYVFWSVGLQYRF